MQLPEGSEPLAEVDELGVAQSDLLFVVHGVPVEGQSLEKDVYKRQSISRE